MTFKRGNKQTGGTLVELALILPLGLGALLYTLGLGLTINSMQHAQTSTRFLGSTISRQCDTSEIWDAFDKSPADDSKLIDCLEDELEEYFDGLSAAHSDLHLIASVYRQKTSSSPLVLAAAKGIKPKAATSEFYNPIDADEFETKYDADRIEDDAGSLIEKTQTAFVIEVYLEPPEVIANLGIFGYSGFSGGYRYAASIF